MTRWSRIVLEPFKQKVFDLVFARITEMRDSPDALLDVQSRLLLKDILKMLADLGVYHSMFEHRFLAASVDYYAAQGLPPPLRC